jgi:hypothetical protein
MNDFSEGGSLPARVRLAASVGSGRAASRRPGRPIEMGPNAVLRAIARLARRREGLYRVHRTHAALYSRARRQFGSWSQAVRAAGLDYEGAVTAARSRSIETRRRSRR